MAEQQKSSWWSSMPGLLTAATGFVAALSGLVAGLNQLGVFKREEPAARIEVTAEAPREREPEPEDRTATATRDSVERGVASEPAAKAAPDRPAASASTSVARPVTPPPTPAPIAKADPAKADPAKADPAPVPADTSSAPAGVVLPPGTVLEIATALRVCPPASGQRRFTALLAAPVRGPNGSIPAGTPAVLRIRRDDAPARVQVRLDSLLPRGGSVAIPRASVAVPRGAVSDACLRPGARVRATLSARVTIPRS